MTQQVQLKIQGLYTFPSHLSAVPAGALLKAKNLVINRDGIGESRRGYKIYGTPTTNTGLTTVLQLLTYKGRIFRHYGVSSGSILDYDSDGAGTFNSFSIATTGDTHSNTTIDNIPTTALLEAGMSVSGTNIPANTTIASITNNTSIVLSNAATDSVVGKNLTFTWNISEVSQGTRIKSIEQNGNLYFTTSKGIKKISCSSASNLSTANISNAGGVKALDLSLAINSGNGFLDPQSVVAYRTLWGIKDNNQNLILGTPSNRSIIRNTLPAGAGNSRTVDLTINIPRGVTTSHFYQIYRTAVVADPAGTQDPGDEEQLVYEGNPSASDINTGYLTVTDVTPESFREGGANLYTNQNSGEGILQANDIPPLSLDITAFKGYTFYGNTKTRERLDLSLLSVVNFVPYASGSITSNSAANPTVITSASHGLTTGRQIVISGSNSTPSINGTYTVTVINSNSFSIPVNVTIAGTSGTWYTSDAASTFTITDGTTTNVYTFATAEDAANKRVLKSSAATPSQQVEETANSLVRVINRQASELVYGYYLSGPTDVPGEILLESRSLSQNAFYINVDSNNTGIEFNPVIPTSGNSVKSDNEVCPNRLYYSKYQQPEAVPTTNYIDVGPKDKAIIRVLALRDNLFILKEDGVYRLSGLVSPFTVYPFDFSTIIKAPDSAVVLNNLIYLYSSQGVGTISDTGISVISRPIEDDIIKLLISDYSNFGTSTFGVSYESDRSYYLFTVTNTTDTYATQCFRYNTFTNSWTKPDLSKRCGIVNPSDDRLYLAPNDVSYIEQERKSFDRTDFADREHVLNLLSSSVNGNIISLPSLANITVGDVGTQVQYVTINDINQLLSKLDLDGILTFKQYHSTYQMSAGGDVSSTLDNIINEIAVDAGRVAVSGHTSGATYTALTPTPNTFSGQQTTFNNLINLLNNDSGVGYKNYQTLSGTTTFEFNITALNNSLSTITANNAVPLIIGPLTIYNHIDVEMLWAPQFLSDVSLTKHVSEGTLIFEDSSFTSATLAYATDLSANYESVTISGFGNGTFGNFTYGQGIYGGNGSGIPFRTYVPREKQRCRYINVKFLHSIARENFSLYGYSLTFNPISQRGWR